MLTFISNPEQSINAKTGHDQLEKELASHYRFFPCSLDLSKQLYRCLSYSSLAPDATMFVANCYFPTMAAKITSLPTCSSCNMILTLLLGGVYAPSPWICNCGGSDVMWFLQLGDRASTWVYFFLGCLLLETMPWGRPKWLSWRDCMERPGRVFQWGPSQQPSLDMGVKTPPDYSRLYHLLSHPDFDMPFPLWPMQIPIPHNSWT